MLCDYHVHTQFSDDSEYPIEEVVKDAIKKGLSELCFTDHVDYGVKRDWDEEEPVEFKHGVYFGNVDYPKYVSKIYRLQEKYGDQIALKLGLEFGMQMHTIPRYEKLFACYPFDFIILSVHEVEDKEFWTQDFQRGRTQQEYNERYYEEILRLVLSYHNYSVLGHLDLITRYDEAGLYPFEKVKPLVTEILKTVIADGKGIEFNTSYHRYGLSDTTPSLEILQLYKELGGTVLTIGSDSHRPEHLGSYLDEAKAILKEVGFEHFCTFERMQPTFHAL